MTAMPTGWTTFAASSNAQDFQWGQRDCMLDIGDWLFATTRIDLSSKWRGRYGSADECRALFRRDGGITRVMRREAAAAGLVETDRPKPGDIGLVKAFGAVIRARRGALFPMGGILMASGRWRVRALEGHITHPFPLIVAWALPCRR